MLLLNAVVDGGHKLISVYRKIANMKSEERIFKNVTEKRRKNMSNIRGKDTTIEVCLRKELWHRGYRYRKNYKKLPGSPDIAITKHKIAIFCDSEFFHGKDWEVLRPKLQKGNNGNYWVKKIEENIERDRSVDQELLIRGWTVIHFWGKDILKNLSGCIQVVEEAVLETVMRDPDREGSY